MPRKIKIFLLFAPLIAAFTGLFFVVQDLKNPIRNTEACRVLAVGAPAGDYREAGNTNVLYTASGNPNHDVALACTDHGAVVVNDFDVFMVDIAAGDKATLRHTRYRYLPERWQLEITPDIEARRQAKS